MLLRKILLTAVVAAPLAWNPALVSAQERGLERAAVSTAHADAVAGWTKKSPKNKAPTALPAGVARVFEGQTLPPGISRTRVTPPVVPNPDPGDEGEGEECEPEITFVDGVLTLRDCNGNLTPLV